MITESDIEVNSGTCCAAHARITYIRRDSQFGLTAQRSGNHEIIKWDYTFQCTECFRIFLGYIICNVNDDGYVLGEYLDEPYAVPISKMARTFAKLNL